MQENHTTMIVPKFKTEKLHIFVLVSLMWLSLVCLCVEASCYLASFCLSLINLFFHN